MNGGFSVAVFECRCGKSMESMVHRSKNELHKTPAVSMSRYIQKCKSINIIHLRLWIEKCCCVTLLWIENSVHLLWNGP